MVKTQDLGAITAYAIAVKYGFSGTEQEWANAVDAQRQAASASATSAANSASEALTAANSAKASAASISSSVISANSSANSAKNSADSATASATSAANSLTEMQNTVAHTFPYCDCGDVETDLNTLVIPGLYKINNYKAIHTFYSYSGKYEYIIVSSEGLNSATVQLAFLCTPETSLAAYVTIRATTDCITWTTTVSNADLSQLSNTLAKADLSNITDAIFKAKADAAGVTTSGGITQEQADERYAKKYSISSVILAAASWIGTSAPFTQDITITGATSASVIGILPSDTATADNRSAWRSALISGVSGTNKITIVADGDKPTTDIPMSITVWG